MKIAYRRMSGAIGVTDAERGTRGLWWEKRKALFKELMMRGHEVSIVNRLTEPSKHIGAVDKFTALDCGLLIVEFGSSNTQFYGSDLEETKWLAENFKGPKVFICDDPDLPFIWEWAKKPNEWTCWYNANLGKAIGKEPIGVKIVDFPFSSLQDALEPREDYLREKFVYIGRPLGRGPAVRNLIAGRVPWRIYGKPKEWEEFGVAVHAPPDQPQRAQFYSMQLGSLVLADRKHKQLGWRTGRAYHAVLAGCPAVVELDHKALQGFAKWRSTDDLMKLHARWMDPNHRHDDWKKQIQYAWFEKELANGALKALNL